MSKQTAIEMYSHLYGKEVTMDDRFETKVIWSEELAIKNNGKWIPKEVTMSKQTALQWFKDVSYPYLDKESKEYIDILFNHALQMEREQIVEAHIYGQIAPISKIKIHDAEQYYNETYGGNNE